MITQYDYLTLKFIEKRRTITVVDLMMKFGISNHEAHELLHQIYMPNGLIRWVGVNGNTRIYKVTAKGKREIAIYEEQQKNSNVIEQKKNFWEKIKKILAKIAAYVIGAVTFLAGIAQIADSPKLQSFFSNFKQWLCG